MQPNVRTGIDSSSMFDVTGQKTTVSWGDVVVGDCSCFVLNLATYGPFKIQFLCISWLYLLERLCDHMRLCFPVVCRPVVKKLAEETSGLLARG